MAEVEDVVGRVVMFADADVVDTMECVFLADVKGSRYRRGRG